MKRTEDDIRPDGGTAAPSESPFDIAAETELSQRERYLQLFDRAVLAPVRIAWNDWRARIGIIVVLFYFVIGTIGVVVIEPPQVGAGPRMVGAFQNLKFPLGTNNMGQGLLALTIHATPAMLKMISAGAVFASAMAAIVGTVSGYKGGTVDRVLMTFTDIMMTIPGLPLVIVIAVILQPRNPFLVGLILTINAWAGLARTVRAQVLTLREESYVEAARIMGFSTPSIIKNDLLPNLMPYIMINFVQSARNVIFSSVGLYFLGVLPFTNQNWGVIINLAYKTGGALYTLKAAHWLIVPMVAIVTFSLGLVLLAQGMDRLFNPRVRARHAKTLTEGEGEAREEEGAGPETLPGMG